MLRRIREIETALKGLFKSIVILNLFQHLRYV